MLIVWESTHRCVHMSCGLFVTCRGKISFIDNLYTGIKSFRVLLHCLKVNFLVLVTLVTWTGIYVCSSPTLQVNCHRWGEHPILPPDVIRHAPWEPMPTPLRQPLNLPFKGTVSPDIGLHFSFWKIKLVLSAGPLLILKFFYFVVPEMFKNGYLNSFYENTY
jgi:hypothetical protein